MKQPLTLAITTIEDLLVKHFLSECDSSKLESIKLAIPEYKRPFKWTEKNAIRLIDDIVDAIDVNVVIR